MSNHLHHFGGTTESVMGKGYAAADNIIKNFPKPGGKGRAAIIRHGMAAKPPDKVWCKHIVWTRNQMQDDPKKFHWWTPCTTGVPSNWTCCPICQRLRPR